MKIGIVAEMIVPTDADVPATPKVCETWPTPMPSTPSAATRGNARHGIECRPTMTKISSSGAATPKRIAVSVRGGNV